MSVKDFLIGKIIGEYKDSLELQAKGVEEKIRKKLEKYSQAELWGTGVQVEVTARIVPRRR